MLKNSTILYPYIIILLIIYLAFLLYWTTINKNVPSAKNIKIDNIVTKETKLTEVKEIVNLPLNKPCRRKCNYKPKYINRSNFIKS